MKMHVVCGQKITKIMQIIIKCFAHRGKVHNAKATITIKRLDDYIPVYTSKYQKH